MNERNDKNHDNDEIVGALNIFEIYCNIAIRQPW